MVENVNPGNPDVVKARKRIHAVTARIRREKQLLQECLNSDTLTEKQKSQRLKNWIDSVEKTETRTPEYKNDVNLVSNLSDNIRQKYLMAYGRNPTAAELKKELKDVYGENLDIKDMRDPESIVNAYGYGMTSYRALLDSGNALYFLENYEKFLENLSKSAAQTNDKTKYLGKIVEDAVAAIPDGSVNGFKVYSNNYTRNIPDKKISSVFMKMRGEVSEIQQKFNLSNDEIKYHERNFSLYSKLEKNPEDVDNLVKNFSDFVEKIQNEKQAKKQSEAQASEERQQIVSEELKNLGNYRTEALFEGFGKIGIYPEKKFSPKSGQYKDYSIVKKLKVKEIDRMRALYNYFLCEKDEFQKLEIGTLPLKLLTEYIIPKLSSAQNLETRGVQIRDNAVLCERVKHVFLNMYKFPKNSGEKVIKSMLDNGLGVYVVDNYETIKEQEIIDDQKLLSLFKKCKLSGLAVKLVSKINGESTNVEK